jgi:hypothetical protein
MTLGWLILAASLSGAVHSPGDARKSIESELSQARAKQDELRVRENLRRRVGPDYKALAEFDKHTKKLEDERDLHFNRAIRKTLVAYGIVPVASDGRPDMPTGETVFPGAEGRKATWVAISRKNQPLRVILSNGKTKRISMIPENKIAATTATGVTLFAPERVSGLTADALALVLIHEKRHFEAFTTKGEGDVKTQGEREQLAVRAEQDVLDHIGLTNDSKNTFRLQLRSDMSEAITQSETEKAAIESLLRKAGRILGITNKDDFADYHASTFGAAETIEEFELLKKEARAIDSKLREEEELRHFATLREFARRFCYEMDSPPTQAELDALTAYPAAVYQQRVFAIQNGASCQATVYSNIIRVLSYGNALEVAELESFAAQGWANFSSRPGPQAQLAEPQHTPVAELSNHSQPTATLGKMPKHPPMAAFELADLATRACLRGASGQTAPNWFPSPGLDMIEAASLGLDSCAQTLYRQLVAANEAETRFSADLLALPASNSGNGSDSGNTKPRGGIDTKPANDALDKARRGRFKP